MGINTSASTVYTYAQDDYKAEPIIRAQFYSMPHYQNSATLVAGVKVTQLCWISNIEFVLYYRLIAPCV